MTKTLKRGPYGRGQRSPRRPSRRALAATALAASVLLAGCATVGPDYAPQTTPAAAAWATPVADGLAARPADAEALAAWWRSFEDPVLVRLVEQALEANPDLAAARARVRQARAILGIRRSDRLPAVDASGSATYNRTSDATGTGGDTELYRLAIDAGWELDLFGGIRRGVEAAVAELGASVFGLADVQVSLAAEVASAYVDLRTFQARLAFAEANRAAQQETFDLASSRFDAGLVGRLDVEQARSNLESTRSQIPTLRIGIGQSAHRLAVLTGRPPGSAQSAASGLLSQTAPIPGTPVSVAVGVPAEALRRRPDVRAAERRVAAETARIGVATAELYPRFSLGGSVGLESLDLGDLVDGGSSFFGIGPSFSWRLFDRRAIRAGIEAQSALQEEALHLYEGTVLFALREVEDALLAYAEEQIRRQTLGAAAAAAERAADLARDLYRSGLRTFQDVLDAQRSLLSFQDQLALSEGAVTTDLIRLFKALGGGWTPLSAAEPTATAAAAGERNP